MTNLKTGIGESKSLSGLQDKPESSRSALGGRIREAREELGVPRNESSSVVGVSLSTFQAWEAGEREPDATKLSIFARHYGISADWLLFGEGPMRKGEAEVAAPSPQREPSPCICQDTLGNPVSLEDFVFIPHFNLKAAAAHGSATDGEKPVFSMAFRRYWVEHYLRADPKDLSVLSVKGDSMEGVLNDRDAILVNHTDNEPGTGLYVLRLDGDLIVKRVQRIPGGRLKVLSANEAYEPFEVDLNKPTDDFAIIGRVVWYGRQV
ncbi:transcriptional regulator [Pseudogulbenkiania sp. NH8B]|nr:transcriptional regulator [Pseudogulbenkiania sp. NH8B]BAK76887.1 transcriptional regulator [Pseudogulbenkiania sp. NH8B]